MPATDHRQLQAAVQESREHSVLFVQLPALQLQALATQFVVGNVAFWYQVQSKV